MLLLDANGRQSWDKRNLWPGPGRECSIELVHAAPDSAVTGKQDRLR